MGCISFLCSTKFIFFLLIISAIPIAIIISLERAPSTGHVYHYHSNGFLRECAKWDHLNRRFLVSYMEGGVGEIRVPDDYQEGVVLEEITTVKDADLGRNGSAGISIDRPRNRLLVVVGDMIGNRYCGLAAYDLSSWRRLFLAHLGCSQGDEKSFGDDVTVDEEGNAYVTDVLGSKIWKVSVDGELLSPIRSPLFSSRQWYKNLLGLNGILYHPDDYLLVVHSLLGNLYKIDLKNGNEEVKLVRISGSLILGDGLQLLSPTKLVVAGIPSRLVESSDGWETAVVTGKFWGPIHRLGTSVTVKEGKAYLNHMFGFGYPKKKHAIVEPIFSS